MISKPLIEAIVAQYVQPLEGRHGLAHWARVLENGRLLADLTDADLAVVEHFAVFHDACRKTESFDPGHGARGAELARRLHKEGLVPLNEDQLALLTHACEAHTDGLITGDLAVRVCWDSDRLDLGRAGIRPAQGLLCTGAARDSELMQWAGERSLAGHRPDLLATEWGITLKDEIPA
ncbi:hypothetical protein [Desulfoluna butyratoxydans]|uniref:HD domain-containing protein n=1 Tax=Desulfoluna butyratoxydans TaxID=231438 RepID=A0A4U8YQ75_9BACT|nr:hypothetical protein [Desulfoluna butyratoxydans]VFQ45587.1 hypothetical protein MSL71_32480 [Desulfoluna butyratoxydans]